MKEKESNFEIKRNQLIILGILIFSYFIIGKIISLTYTSFFGQELTSIQKNIIIFLIDFFTTVVLLFSLRHFIIYSFGDLKSKGIKNIIKWIILGFILELLMALSGYLLMTVLVLIGGIDILSLNQEAVGSMVNNYIIINFIDIVIIGPFIEECFFRVFVFGILKNKMFISILISAFLFGIAHVMQELINGEISIALVTMITYVFSGVAFAIIYAKRKNFLVPMIVHSLWNLIGFSLNLLKGI